MKYFFCCMLHLYFCIWIAGCSASTTSSNLQNATSKQQSAIALTDKDSSVFQKAVDVTVGPGVSCAILENGEGKCWGSSFFGHLGESIGYWQDFKNASVIGAGVNAACAAVGPDRELKCTGKSILYGLNQGPKNRITGVREIAMDKIIGCAISPNLVSCWGHDAYGNDNGATGMSYKNPRKLRVFDSMSCVAADEGVFCWNSVGWKQGTPNDLQHVTDLAVSGDDVCATDDVRGLVCWHSNQNSFNEYSASISKIKMSDLHFENFHEICGLAEDQIQCLNLDTLDKRFTPKPVKTALKWAFGSKHGCALSDVGVTCWGSNENGETTVPRGFNKPFQIATARNFSCALDLNGIDCWGDNYHDQITPPFIVKNPVQLATNGYTTCIDDEDRFRCWTQKQSDLPGGIELDVSNELHGARSLTMARDFAEDRICGIKASQVVCVDSIKHKAVVQGLQNPKELSLYENGGCAISNDGIRCWSWGYEQLISTLISIPINSPRLLSVDTVTSCAVTVDGLKCWNKDNKFLPTPGLTEVREIKTSGGSSCAIHSEGVSCWNNFGNSVIPDPGTSAQITPVPAMLEAPRNLSMSTNSACVVTNTGLRCWEKLSGNELLIPDYNLAKP